jgi:predicted Rossmann-fold nucleotide-binding protein
VRRFPVVLFGSEYWKGLMTWLSERPLREDKIDPDDLRLLTVSDSTEETCQFILDAYQRLDGGQGAGGGPPS